MQLPDDSFDARDYAQVTFSPETEIEVPNLVTITERVMDFNKCTKGFHDSINTLEVVEKQGKVLVGTEQGKIYLVDVANNRVQGFMRADRWLSCTTFSAGTVASAGLSKHLELHSLKTMKRIFRWSSGQTLEAFSRLGIAGFRVGRCHHIIVNLGYLHFGIINPKTRRVLKTFSLPTEQLLEEKVQPPELAAQPKIVLNYLVARNCSSLAVLLQEDPRLYLFDFFSMRMRGVVTLYSSSDILPGFQLYNSLLLQSSTHLLLLLQFVGETRFGTRVSTYLFVLSVSHAPEPELRLHFTLEIEKIGFVVSADIREETLLRVQGVEQGFMVVVGTSDGMSRTLNIDTKKQKYYDMSNFQKSGRGSDRSHRRRNNRNEDVQARHHLRDV